MLDKISGGETERKMTQTKIVETGIEQTGGSLKHLHQEIIEHIHPYVATKRVEYKEAPVEEANQR